MSGLPYSAEIEPPEPSDKVEVHLGNIIKETRADPKTEMGPFVDFSRVDTLTLYDNIVLIGGPVAVSPENTAQYVERFGTLTKEGEAVLPRVTEGQFGTQQIEIVSPDQLPAGLVWSNKKNLNFSGIGPRYAKLNTQP